MTIPVAGPTKLEEEVARLSAEVRELQRRIEIQTPSPRESAPSRRSRRDLLRLAGAAAVGAAGGVVLRAAPAAAATGGSMILGNANNADATTSLAPSAVTNNIPAQLSVSANMSGVSAAGSSSVGIKGDATPGTGIGASATGVAGSASTSVASISATGVSGTATTSVPPTGSAGTNGVIGAGNGSAFAAGVFGKSDKGWGVFGDGGVGVDLAAGGTGRIVQVPLMTSPGPPTGYVPNNYEQVRDGNGVIWVSNNSGAWRRINTIIPVTPFRGVDTRDGTGGGWTTPFASGETRLFGPFPGIPTDAVGLFGNVTAAGFNGGGYFSIFPGGIAWPGHASLNFAAGFGATGWGNFFIVGVGTGPNAGKISIRLSSNGIQSHVIVDVFGYIQ